MKRREFLATSGAAALNASAIGGRFVSAAPKMHKVIEPDEIKKSTGLSAPHTVHCLGDGTIVLSMLGDAEGNAPGGFWQLDADFKIVGRWEKSLGDMKYNYDFWYQPRHNVMVSSEWGAPKTYQAGFKVEDVAAGKYGTQIHFWDFIAREPKQTIDLGEQGRIPLEVRVTSSLFSAWDDQFYPDLRKKGSFLLQIDCDTERGGMKINDKFFVDFGKEPQGPSRAHEMRYPGGDCTSDIWT